MGGVVKKANMTIYGLSTTAIGHRPLSEAINIYETLKSKMNLSYLELAIGTLSIINEEYWHFYKTFTRRDKVLQVHHSKGKKYAILLYI
jgi:hypothetical protein